MATPLAINEKGFTVLYEARQPAVEYVLVHARYYLLFCTATECTAMVLNLT